MISVGLGPWWISFTSRRRRSDAGSDNCYKGSGKEDPDERQAIHLPGLGGGRVVAVIIRRNATPTRPRGEVEREEAQDTASEAEAGVKGWSIGSNMRCGLSDQDAHQDKAHDP